MKICCISDLHGHLPTLESGDLLIVAGDLTATHTHNQYCDFRDWLLKQDYTTRIVIAGNHDQFFYHTHVEKLDVRIYVTEPDRGKIYLCDSGTEFEGLKIWGSPWTKSFPGMNPICKAFTVDTDEELEEKWNLIPDDIDILVTHSPPYGILDGVEDYLAGNILRCGSPSLRGAVERIRPKYHIFGHIHSEGGKKVLLKNGERDTWCINASIMDERYNPIHKPVYLEI